MNIRQPDAEQATRNAETDNDPNRELMELIDTSSDAVVTLSSDYPDGHTIAFHRHSRSQLLYALSGVVMVSTSAGRWMVPPEHAIWLPAGIEHGVEMLGSVEMRSVYVRPGEREELPSQLRVVVTSDLFRALIIAAAELPGPSLHTEREKLVHDLLLQEIPRLQERPLALPFPRNPRLVTLCREFLIEPRARTTINEWANAAGMSRRNFTRIFQHETGLGLSTWRQQACLFAALPRLAEGESVTSVALDLGYDSVSAFTTMFKRMLGKPPRVWLSQVRYSVGS